MSVITMHKYHGLGNDYLVLDPNLNQIRMQERKIRLLCRRNFGVGADGILYGPLPGKEKPEVLIYNSDGSEAAESGNGVRIFAKYLKDFGYVAEQKFILATKSGDVEVEFLDEDGNWMRVNMGKADFLHASLTADRSLHEILNEPLMFHGNLQLCKVVNREKLKIEIYERGSGYTLASGTGACAAAAAAFRMGLTENKMAVEMPGGELLIEITEDGTIYMTGTVKRVGTFTLAEDFFA